MHAPPHATGVAEGQVQVPPTQVSPATWVQSVPWKSVPALGLLHFPARVAPQCTSSVCGLMQVAPHSTSLLAHWLTQFPCEQKGVVPPQGFPQVPQFFGSVCLLVQKPTPVVAGGVGQASGRALPATQRHWPLWQVDPGMEPQFVPAGVQLGLDAPQKRLSVLGSMQVGFSVCGSLQSASPCAQVLVHAPWTQ